MTYTVDRLTKIITVPQADLTFIGGTLYELDTEDFRTRILLIQESEEGIVELDMHTRNAPVTVGGVTYAQTIEIINGYSVEFTPDSQYSVRLAGSNNNIFDVENGILVQNQVQLIANNAAGLIEGNINDQTVEGSLSVGDVLRILVAAQAGDVSGGGTSTITIKSADGLTTRMIATVDANGNRTITFLDAS